jgi:hypothetical protein
MVDVAPLGAAGAADRFATLRRFSTVFTDYDEAVCLS